jgi:ABC-type cobalamin/Fe3+-siderophores transport system ATPase subunit/predicted ATPase
MLKLKRFRVTNFRSVRDSGWVDTDAVTALIGTNESGKTNMLIPLWKLNPAKDGEIDLIADFPRAEYNRMRRGDEHPVFVQAEFETDGDLRAELARITQTPPGLFERVHVARRFNGDHVVTFPNAAPPRSISKVQVVELLRASAGSIGAEKPQKKEEATKTAMTAAIAHASKQIDQLESDVTVADIAALQAAFDAVNLGDPPEHSTLVPRWKSLGASFVDLAESISRPPPEEIAEATAAVIDHLPSFVYYSNYGNLDSEIYLPHVIANMKRDGLGPKEAGKARTLKVLFEYVRLSPQEILDLGTPAPIDPKGAAPTQAAIDEAARRTKERTILLRSADTELTKSFRDWWKQGDYRFRFAADGDHFRIWVSDERRPEEIELESRSTGLQWFFSFFLVFLVERRDAHRGAVLLLDEPGLSLHPLSQRDLSVFFENLSHTNPIIYTTHSPFMVDADHLDRVRLVYVDSSGSTAVSSDLRATSHATSEGRSVYAVHAALGLSVSMALLQGCISVVVEGPSDQIYLSCMKTVLVARKMIAPKREILFVPAGGARGVTAIAPIVAAKDDAPPIVLLDDDRQGRQFGDALRSSVLYKGAQGRILNVREFVPIDGAEIEDVMPPAVVADVASRVVRGREDDFRDVVQPGVPIVPQIEAYALKNGVALEPGWKVELARLVKQRLLKDLDRIEDSTIETWSKLFGRIDA